jgi:hypothetical protein
MLTSTILDELSRNDIFPIKVAIIRDNEEDYEVFLFLDKLLEYIKILKKLNIKSVFIQEYEVREEEFNYYVDEEFIKILKKDPLINIEDDGLVQLTSIRPELEKYKKYIGQVHSVKLIAIIDGKEFTLFINEDWSTQFTSNIRVAIDSLEEIVETLESKSNEKQINRKRH